MAAELGVCSAKADKAESCRLAQLPTSVKHLVIVFTVPVTFPKLPLSETVLSTIEGMPLLKGAIIKTGVGAGIMDKYGFSSPFLPPFLACNLHRNARLPSLDHQLLVLLTLPPSFVLWRLLTMDLLQCLPTVAHHIVHLAGAGSRPSLCWTTCRTTGTRPST